MKHKPTFEFYPGKDSNTYKIRCADCGKVLVEINQDDLEDCEGNLSPTLGVHVQEIIKTKDSTG